MPDGKIMLDLTTDHLAIWKAMEEQVDAGKAKTIGLSNFNQLQIQRVLDNARIKPASLQIELHAYMQQKELVDFCRKNDVVVTAYSPLGSLGLDKFMESMGLTGKKMPNILSNHVVEKIGKKHGKSAAQVVLRHAVQKGIVVIPKSTNAGRLKMNFDIFNFELDQEDMRELNGLDKGPAGRIFDFSFFDGVHEHPEYPF